MKTKEQKRQEALARASIWYRGHKCFKYFYDRYPDEIDYLDQFKVRAQRSKNAVVPSSDLPK